MLPLRLVRSVLLTLYFCAPLAASDAFAQTYIELDFVPVGISGDGQIVVGEEGLWSPTLGDLGSPVVSADLVATNEDGSIVAGDFSRSLVREAFVATDPTGVQTTGFRDLGYIINAAKAMSGNGAFVALDSVSPSGREYDLWTPATNDFVEIDVTIVPGATPPILNDISNGGVVVGRDGNAEAFRWGPVNGSGFLDVPVGSASEAAAISDAGDWIAGQAGTEAVRWNAAGARSSLGVPGGLASWASSISGDGSTIGGGAFGFDGAFLWTEPDGYQNLAVMLTAMGIDYGSPFWVLRDVVDISTDGRTIVGTRFNAGGGSAGFYFVVPEPGTGLLLGLGLAALTRRRQPANPLPGRDSTA